MTAEFISKLRATVRLLSILAGDNISLAASLMVAEAELLNGNIDAAKSIIDMLRDTYETIGTNLQQIETLYEQERQQTN